MPPGPVSRGPGLCPGGRNRCRAPSCHRFVPPGPGNYGAGLCVAVLAAVEAPATRGGGGWTRSVLKSAGPEALPPARAFCLAGRGAFGPSAAKRRRPPHSPPGRTARAAAFLWPGPMVPAIKTCPLPGAARQRAGGLRPPAAAPPTLGFPPTPKGTTGQGQPKGYLWYGSPALILQAR